MSGKRYENNILTANEHMCVKKRV